MGLLSWIGGAFRGGSSRGVHASADDRHLWRTIYAQSPDMSLGRHAGERVTSDLALTIPAYVAGLRWVSDMLAQPGCVMTQTDRGQKRDRLHRVTRLFNRRMSRELTSTDGLALMESWRISHGVTFGHIIRDATDEIVELTPIHPNRVKLDEWTSRLTWRVASASPTNRRETVVDDSDFIRVRGFGGDEFRGIMLLQYAAATLGRALAAGNFASSFFANGLNMQGVIETDPTIDAGRWASQDENRKKLAREWHEKMSGARNANQTTFLIPGQTYRRIAVTPEEAQVIEAGVFTIREIARMIGAPPFAMMDYRELKYATAEQQDLASRQTIIHAMRRWEQEITSKLLADDEVYEFDVNAMSRADTAARTAMYNGAMQSGWLTANEVREREGYEWHPDGDELRANGTMAAVGGGDGSQDPQQSAQVDPSSDPQNDPSSGDASDSNA